MATVFVLRSRSSPSLKVPPSVLTMPIVDIPKPVVAMCPSFVRRPLSVFTVPWNVRLTVESTSSFLAVTKRHQGARCGQGRGDRASALELRARTAIDLIFSLLARSHQDVLRVQRFRPVQKPCGERQTGELPLWLHGPLVSLKPLPPHVLRPRSQRLQSDLGLTAGKRSRSGGKGPPAARTCRCKSALPWAHPHLQGFRACLLLIVAHAARMEAH